MTWIVTAVVVSSVATGASIANSNKASKAQRKQAEIERKINERTRKREQFEQLRQAQIARASAIASGVNTGTTDTSGLQGQVSSIQSQSSSNIAFSNMVQTGANVAGMYAQQAADYNLRANTWSSIAQLSLQAAQFAEPKAKAK